MGDICCNSFVCADDMVILSPSCDALRIWEQYATRFSLSFNHNKCVLMISWDLDVFMGSVWNKMYSCTIHNFKSEECLAHLIPFGGSPVNLEPVIRDMKVRTNVITHHFYSTSCQSNVLLFNSHCIVFPIS